MAGIAAANALISNRAAPRHGTPNKDTTFRFRGSMARNADTNADVSFARIRRGPPAGSGVIKWLGNWSVSNWPLAARLRVGHIGPTGDVAEWLKAAVC